MTYSEKLNLLSVSPKSLLIIYPMILLLEVGVNKFRGRSIFI